jgi:hypothetical protein
MRLYEIAILAGIPAACVALMCLADHCRGRLTDASADMARLARRMKNGVI